MGLVSPPIDLNSLKLVLSYSIGTILFFDLLWGLLY